MAKLFQQGFFGKGTLSRSEATWKQRNAKDAQGVSLEDITRQRRIERAQLKKDKAQGKAIGPLPATTNKATYTETSAPASPLIPASASSSVMPSPLLSASSNDSTNIPKASSILTPPPAASTTAMTQVTVPILQRETEPDQNYEHLQLSLEEAFFLVFAIEVIEVADSESSEHRTVVFSILDCWRRFAQASLARPTIATSILPEFRLEPDNPFIVRYVVYHYFRSQGWVVKDGLKYGTDFMLYRKGMVFGHSQYGVRVIPCHDFKALLNNPESRAHSSLSMQSIQPVMSPTPGSSLPHTVYSWQWLLGLNRIISQVQKTTLICHVVLPESVTPQQLSHPRTALPLYSVVELGIKRFLPERNRA
ncbi:hypothetical protein MVEG_09759 [Podila verticillata NRRL 6337]|nr:hypothetical protein MVEG_09759 [Podila verticillata NRRL 6337]